MAGILSDDSGVGSSMEGFSSEQMLCESWEALAEWRSSEQLENGNPSTSPPYWDTDDDDDLGPKTCELYGKYTWKIDKFSQINKRELRSNALRLAATNWIVLNYWLASTKGLQETASGQSIESTVVPSEAQLPFFLQPKLYWLLGRALVQAACPRDGPLRRYKF